MMEIVVDIIAIGGLHIEILISLGHRMCLGDMSYYMDALCYFAGPVYQDESVAVNLWPLRSNTMEIPPLRKELSTLSIWRNNNLSTFVDTQEVLQPSSMVAMPMRDKHIVNRTEVDAYQLCIAYKNITGPRVK